MNSTARLLLILSLVFWFLGTWFYSWVNPIKCCPGETAVVAPVKKKVKEPLMFNWNDAKTITYDKFPGFKANTLAGNKEGRILEITGKYFDKETTPSGFANMGLARATAIWKEQFPEIPETRIKLLAEKVAERDGVRTEEFTNAVFKWVDAPTDRKVIETKDKALIYFDYNATQKKLDPAIDGYLKRLSERLKQNASEKVIITGHTDSDGDADANFRLGDRRAKTVRDILVRYGINRARVTTQSKGQTEPVESNDTKTGKALNRRAVVQVIQ